MSVSWSSYESEYYALDKTEKEKVWLHLLPQELGHIFITLTII